MAAEDIFPTIILVVIVYGLYRWLTGPKTPSDPLAAVRRDMAFPHESIDAVVYSLSRTRSAQATSEVILERGSLPAPPTGFTVPDRLRPTLVASSAPSTAAAEPAAASKPTSLIDRYGLASRLTAEGAAPAGKWEATREGRENDLRARKERMILEARRRMLEKEKAASPVKTE